MFSIIISNATEKLNCRKKMAFALSTLKYIHIDRKFIIHKILSKLMNARSYNFASTVYTTYYSYECNA